MGRQPADAPRALASSVSTSPLRRHRPCQIRVHPRLHSYAFRRSVSRFGDAEGFRLGHRPGGRCAEATVVSPCRKEHTVWRRFRIGVTGVSIREISTVGGIITIRIEYATYAAGAPAS